MVNKILLAWLLLFPTALFSQTPPGGKDLIPQPALDSIRLDGDKGSMEKVSVPGQPFQQALKLTTFEDTENPWTVQVEAVVPVAVKTGDVLLAEFWVKADETHVEKGEANSEFVFERLGDPWTKAVSYGISVGPHWKKFSIPFTAVEDLDSGKSHICFRMGYRPQAFELGDFRLTTYGTRVKLSDLPQTKVEYAGSEPDAPWRKQALERIEKFRKGDLTVVVSDAAGKPLSGVKVSLRMTRQAFGF